MMQRADIPVQHGSKLSVAQRSVPSESIFIIILVCPPPPHPDPPTHTMHCVKA